MIDPRLAWFAMGATFGLVLCGWPWHPRFSRYSRRRPYSSAAIAFCATQQDAAKVSSQFFNPAVGEPWPEPMTVEEWACRRGSNPPGPVYPRQPEQPLAADLIRYSRWRREQIERALRDQPPN